MNGPEWLSLWYLRLNGYFTLPNFIAHGRGGPLTEVDVLGVRFPYSEEAEFEDDAALRIPNQGTDIVFAEAKTRQINVLNGPWGRPETGALDYVLRRVGILPEAQVAALAAALYVQRATQINGVTLRIICFAETIGDELREEGVTFIPWAQVLQRSVVATVCRSMCAVTGLGKRIAMRKRRNQACTGDAAQGPRGGALCVRPGW